MMNRNEKLEIAKRLRHLTEMEMSRDDLESMLAAELNKAEAEMDAELVQEILELLEDAPSQAERHESWQTIDKRLKQKCWQPALSLLTRIAASVVILVVLFYATYGTAQALNWEFLLRLMKPFAETFMVYMGNRPDVSPAPETYEVYSDVALTFSQEEFTTLADCPNMVDGYPAKPVWMPEHFTYLQGSMLSDVNIKSITHLFQSDTGICIIDISMFENMNEVNSYHYEQVPNEIDNTYVDGIDVTFYQNADNVAYKASWVSENASYYISGPVSKEEIVTIIESMMK